MITADQAYPSCVTLTQSFPPQGYCIPISPEPLAIRTFPTLWEASYAHFWDRGTEGVRAEIGIHESSRRERNFEIRLPSLLGRRD